MKRCSTCGTISTDEEDICGVCKSSLAGIASVSLEQAETVGEPASRVRVRSDKTGTVILLFSIVLVITGGVGLIFFGLVGFFLLVGGLFSLVIGMDYLSFKTTVLHLRKGNQMNGLDVENVEYREAAREAEEDKRRSSGAAD